MAEGEWRRRCSMWQSECNVLCDKSQHVPDECCSSLLCAAFCSVLCASLTRDIALPCGFRPSCLACMCCVALFAARCAVCTVPAPVSPPLLLRSAPAFDHADDGIREVAVERTIEAVHTWRAAALAVRHLRRRPTRLQCVALFSSLSPASSVHAHGTEPSMRTTERGPLAGGNDCAQHAPMRAQKPTDSTAQDGGARTGRRGAHSTHNAAHRGSHRAEGLCVPSSAAGTAITTGKRTGEHGSTRAQTQNAAQTHSQCDGSENASDCSPTASRCCGQEGLSQARLAPVPGAQSSCNCIGRLVALN